MYNFTYHGQLAYNFNQIFFIKRQTILLILDCAHNKGITNPFLWPGARLSYSHGFPLISMDIIV
jgi:hypothetical protein